MAGFEVTTHGVGLWLAGFGLRFLGGTCGEIARLWEWNGEGRKWKWDWMEMGMDGNGNRIGRIWDWMDLGMDGNGKGMGICISC